jgi:uncharacterized protein (TIGR03437 family)
MLGWLVAGTALAATFGTVVPIGGMASDIALDEGRGLVYLADYGANRIDVVSIATQQVTTSIQVNPYPSSLALSPDGQWLVITHLANFQAPQTPVYGLTILNLTKHTTQTLTPSSPPMGVAFCYNGLAFLVTSTDLMLLNPATGTTQEIMTLESLIAIVPPPLPVLTPASIRAIVGASVAASGDATVIDGTIQTDAAPDYLLVRYDAVQGSVTTANWTSTPINGPRVVSVNQNGSRMLSGWGLYHPQGFLLAEFRNPLGSFGVGSHAINSAINTIYAQVPPSTWTVGTPPVLQIVDADNLTLREQINLKENLAGRSVLNAAGTVMYSISDSGLTILPVGALSTYPQVIPSQQDVVFQGQWCSRGVLTQTLKITDPSGNKTDFSLSTSMPGVSFSPATGTTPATVQVSVDTTSLSGTEGTLSGLVSISSVAAVNLPLPVRVLVNNRQPDQRGTLFDVPGTVVDIKADPVRNRFYVLRQDQNEVLVYNASNYTQIGTLRTGNTPWSMTLTTDNQYLVIGADDSQVAHVYNLNTLQFYEYIVFPGGHYPRFIAVAGKSMLAACRVAGPEHTIDQVQFASGTATTFPSLGPWTNSINVDTALVAAPGGAKIMAAEADGTVLLWDANSASFTVARQDVTALSGAVAALNDNTFIVDHYILDGSLVPVETLETASGSSSGFAEAGGLGLRTTAPNASSPGVIQRVDLSSGQGINPTRTAEAPVLPVTTATSVPPQCQVVFGMTLCTEPTTTTTTIGSGFMRSLVALPNGNAIVSLSTTGFTVLPWKYDTALATPQINSIVSAADGASPVAPGGLFSISGSNLAPIKVASNQVPLPTTLGDSCMTINSELVPLIFVSPSEINGQIPFDILGGSTMILQTQAGVSNSFLFNVPADAPSVFETAIPGWASALPTVVRQEGDQWLTVTPTDPIHPNDQLAIFATGLGAVSPEVNSGYPGPTSPLAQALIEPVVTLGSAALFVSYAGLAPGEVGVYQINAQVPFHGIPTGMSVPLTITQGTQSTTVSVRVVDP